MTDEPETSKKSQKGRLKRAVNVKLRAAVPAKKPEVKVMKREPKIIPMDDFVKTLNVIIFRDIEKWKKQYDVSMTDKDTSAILAGRVDVDLKGLSDDDVRQVRDAQRRLADMDLDQLFTEINKPDEVKNDEANDNEDNAKPDSAHKSDDKNDRPDRGNRKKDHEDDPG